ncbi:MAG: gamma-D-glutamyl-meso-diaminopimelate peptidase [Clostridia bacterium]|nr:gamma-D-glutamyl-meso-diaminopimelate peptidase [Clostridia bacterium]
MTVKEILDIPINKERRARCKAALLSSESLSIQSIGRSTLGEELCMYSFGKGRRAVLYVAAHHALEAITENLLTAFLFDVSERVINDEKYRFLLQTFTYFVIPVLNPDGIALHQGEANGNPLYQRQLKMSGGSFDLWQANARGVDLNHNYSHGFLDYKRKEAELGIFAGSTLYSGEYPESEPESAALMNTVRALSPSLILSLHSQGEELFAVGKHSQALARALSKMTGYAPATPEDTAAYGGFCDTTSDMGIPSVTVEVGRGKNPLPYTAARGIYARLREALLWLPSKL